MLRKWQLTILILEMKESKEFVAYCEEFFKKWPFDGTKGDFIRLVNLRRRDIELFGRMNGVKPNG